MRRKLITIVLPAEKEHLAKIRKTLKEVSSDIGLDDDKIADIEFAVDEAITNIMDHAYKGIVNENNIIIIRMEIKNNKFIIKIIDRGEKFDPTKYPKPDLERHVKEHKTHGLGIFAMLSFMDNVIHKYRRGTGNILILEKNI